MPKILDLDLTGEIGRAMDNAFDSFNTVVCGLEMKQEKVELFLGNHLPNNHTEEKLAALETAEVNPFIANSQEEWEAFLDGRLQKARQLLEEEL